jgi:hypothetical protein
VLTAGEFFALIEDSVRQASTRSDNGIKPELVLVSAAPELIQRAPEISILTAAQIVEVSAVLATDIGRLGYGQAMRGDLVDALSLDAHYVLRPDAEIKWKQQ